MANNFNQKEILILLKKHKVYNILVNKTGQQYHVSNNSFSRGNGRGQSRFFPMVEAIIRLTTNLMVYHKGMVRGRINGTGRELWSRNCNLRQDNVTEQLSDQAWSIIIENLDWWSIDHILTTASSDIQRQIPSGSQLANQNNIDGPSISEQPPWWQPDNNYVNTLPLIQSTFIITAGTSTISVPVTSTGLLPILVETGINTESNTLGASEETLSQSKDESSRIEGTIQLRPCISAWRHLYEEWYHW